MIVDGRKIAQDIYKEVTEKVAVFTTAPKMAVVTCSPNAETQQYLELKKRKATEVGISLVVLELPDTAQTEDVIACVKAVSETVDGIVVQLPMPAQIDREEVLKSVPYDKDPDGFGYEQNEASCIPPVVGAIKEISKLHGIEWKNKKVAIVGHGRLVGKPTAYFASKSGSEVAILTETSDRFKEQLVDADIIVSGVGKPHFISSDMVADDVVIFDAGASEDGGVVVGDIDPDVASKASLLTPVPGGIGPITVAILLRNLVRLVSQ